MGEKSENKLLTVALMQLHISTVAMYLYIYEYIIILVIGKSQLILYVVYLYNNA